VRQSSYEDGGSGDDGLTSDDRAGDDDSDSGSGDDDGDVSAVPQSSTASSQAPTGGRLVSMYQVDRLA
jgi:hypothetical protein